MDDTNEPDVADTVEKIGDGIKHGDGGEVKDALSEDAEATKEDVKKVMGEDDEEEDDEDDK